MEFWTRAGIWSLPESLETEMQQCYPTLDVARELQKARLWLVVNTEKRKTARGMPRFLVSWLNRTVARSDGPRPQVPVGYGYDWKCPHTPRCQHRVACQVVAMRIV